MLNGKKIIAVIPARMASTRLPGKPLLKETGKYLIQHVHERLWPSDFLDEVVIATDDEKIFAACESFGAKVMMTSQDHKTGTDRVIEVAGANPADVVVNVQGDEPLIQPGAVRLAAELIVKNPGAGISTLAFEIDEDTSRDPNVVKVVFDKSGWALYFSRSQIPFKRGDEAVYFKHIGLYAFRRDVLLGFSSLEKSMLEETEKLEQLRALENGIRILVGMAPEDSLGVDTPEDYARFKKIYERSH